MRFAEWQSFDTAWCTE